MKMIIKQLGIFVLLMLTGCASMIETKGDKQVASIVNYLYPEAKEAPQIAVEPTELRAPVRVGVAFVPSGSGNRDLAEADKIMLLDRVKTAFDGYPFIAAIEIIPTSYLQNKGGFADLEKVARMINADVMTLLSYDQVQFNDANELSMLYWTLVGAYLVRGDQYDIQTLVDASVFDARAKKLLFRASGVSQIKGSASMAGFSERARTARLEGYNKAVDALIPRLQAELEAFRHRIRSGSHPASSAR